MYDHNKYIILKKNNVKCWDCMNSYPILMKSTKYDGIASKCESVGINHTCINTGIYPCHNTYLSIHKDYLSMLPYLIIHVIILNHPCHSTHIHKATCLFVTQCLLIHNTMGIIRQYRYTIYIYIYIWHPIITIIIQQFYSSTR